MNITERQWLNAKSTYHICSTVQSRRNARKMRLFGCACCRRIWDLLVDQRSRAGVEVAEQFADGLIDKKGLKAAQKGANEARAHLVESKNGTAAQQWAAMAVEQAVGADYRDPFDSLVDRICHAIQCEGIRTRYAEERLQTDLLRDIFPNPFRPVAFDPDWRTSAAAAIAQQMYDTREFSVMPILADALQDAGCDSEHILNHCRDADQVHVRGCWAVDLVLAKV